MVGGTLVNPPAGELFVATLFCGVVEFVFLCPVFGNFYDLLELAEAQDWPFESFGRAMFVEMLQAGAHYGGGAEQSGKRIDNDLAPQFLEFFSRQQGRASALDHVGEQWYAFECIGDCLQILDVLWCLDEDDVGTGFIVGVAAGDRFIKAARRASIGTTDHHKAAVAASFRGGPHFLDVFGHRDDTFAGEVAAFFWPLLVLENEPGDVVAHELGDGTVDIQWIAVAGVDIGDKRDVDGGRDATGRVHHFGGCQESVVWFAEGRGGDSEAAGEDRVESGLLDEFSAETIVHAGQYEDVGLFQDLPELCCFRSHFSSSRCGLRVPTMGSLASAEGGMKIERLK